MRFSLLIASDEAMLRPTHIEEDIQNMKNNMIGHCKGLQEELVKLDSMCPMHEREVCTAYYKEFRY